MRIDTVAFKDFAPFAEATVTFPEVESSNDSASGEVQFLTGANGTGKTRLLCLLAAACGNRQSLSLRMTQKESSASKMLVSGNGPGKAKWVWISHGDSAVFEVDPWEITDRFIQRGLSEGQVYPSSNRSKSVRDLWPNFLFSALAFRGTSRVTDTSIEALKQVPLGSAEDHLCFDDIPKESQIICQSMANLKITAAMEAMRRVAAQGSRATSIVERFEQAVSRITGRVFSFDVVDRPDVRIRIYWDDVPMSLGQLPDGIRAIMGWLFSCIAKLDAQFPEHPDPLSIPLILLLDEPESHLHPAWQRQVLPAAQSLFPQAQIFVATHSPFVISSVNEGWIHILRANESGTVSIDPPVPCSEGDSYLDVVEDILGVKEWYDPETESLLQRFRALRDEVIRGKGDFANLRVKADEIGARSNSLSELMGREMHQVERLLLQSTPTGG